MFQSPRLDAVVLARRGSHMLGVLASGFFSSSTPTLAPAQSERKSPMDQSTSQLPRIRAIFSDLDGTIVHFPKWFREKGIDLSERQPESNRAEVLRRADGERRGCRLLPASTMGDGVVSDRTVHLPHLTAASPLLPTLHTASSSCAPLSVNSRRGPLQVELVAQLRAEGVLFVIVTGARKSTTLERLPMLPPADAVICETGSRIFRGTTAEGAGTLDAAWEARLAHICGPLDREMPPSDRPEPLWCFCAKLQADGFQVDTRSYYGCFRVDTKGDSAAAERLRQILVGDEMPPSLDWAMNLGKHDIFPAVSGKANAVRYLQLEFGLRPEECACLFDDDNDLGMAACCGTHLLPGLTSESVRRAAAENPGWHVAANAGEGVYAIESLLEDLLHRVRAKADGAASNSGLPGAVAQ